MALTIPDIKRIAHLARIEINDSEADKTLNKITGILTLIVPNQYTVLCALVGAGNTPPGMPMLLPVGRYC